MLMTVLRGKLAVEQSKALIRLFKQMKDYIAENRQLMVTQSDYLALAMKVSENTSEIIIDHETDGMRAYHCGASSKDAGKRITTITRLMEVGELKRILRELLEGPILALR